MNVDLPEVKVKLSGGERGGREVSFRIIGMHCASCSLTVQKAMRSVRGGYYRRTSAPPQMRLAWW